MDCRINLLVIKNKNRLNKLIENNAPYDKILYQSRILDKYIMKQMLEINSKK